MISKPDVFKAPNSDTYIVFGNANIEDMNQSHRDLMGGANQWGMPSAQVLCK